MLAVGSGRIGSDELSQAVVRIVMINCAGCDQLVFDEDCGWRRALVKDIETHSDQVLTITFGEIRHRSNKSRLGLPKL